ncbi:D-alanyl-D-alanine carboxypeptidase family protein [Filibacter tadaridae]|uniref:D-alanyl-D-alanine carboxypeptidase DacB n=1 Tax=Filibacter tadaridae TaxID=2483811 RepID=A0A3P5X4X3_9BACL|nr:D-alanyl-D-alanine carboxypeptidase family protein [Filibacter tadaridae]VDC29333.1 D-alanyl-D-alanine carboxypeptidase DacB precursor [Filibacter tadaridae]
MKRALIVVLFFTLLFSVGAKNAAAGQAWAVIDADTGRFLDGQNENVRLPIASLTKIWTAFTVLESGVPNREVLISSRAASAEGSSIYLKQGMTIDSEALLYGLMLRSGNDAAHALAEHAGGSMEGFVDMMNDNALLYGLNDTEFTNPSGLHDDQHLSTARDTALMLYYAMKNERFRKIATSKNYVYREGDEVYSWQNKHRLIGSDSGAIAGKTGFTKVARRTLATYFEKDGKNIIVVTLNDSDDWKTHTHLAQKTFSAYNLVTIAKKGTYDILPGIEAELENPIRLLLKKDEKDKLSNLIRIPRDKGKSSKGLWTVSFDNEALLTTEVLIQR